MMLSAVQRVLKDDPELSKKEKSSQHYGGSTIDQRLHIEGVVSMTGKDLSVSLGIT